MAVILNNPSDGVAQFIDVFGNVVGQVAVLGLAPDVLNGIEFRCIGWQPFYAKPCAGFLSQSSSRRTVCRQTIADEDNRTTQMSVDFADELNDIVCVGIVAEKFAVQIEPRGPRRSYERPQGGDSIMPSPRMLNGSLSPASPHAATKGLQHVPTFIEKNQASTAFGPPFLSAAKSGFANVGSRLRPFREPAAWATAGSSQVGAVTCQHSPRGIARQTVVQSTPGRAHMSNRGDQTPKPSALCPGPRSTAVADPLLVSAGDQNVAYASIPDSHRVSSVFAIDSRTTHWHRPPRPLPSTISLARKAGPQSSDELLATRDFLWVSWL